MSPGQADNPGHCWWTAEGKYLPGQGRLRSAGKTGSGNNQAFALKEAFRNAGAGLTLQAAALPAQAKKFCLERVLSAIADTSPLILRLLIKEKAAQGAEPIVNDLVTAVAEGKITPEQCIAELRETIEVVLAPLQK